MLNSDKIIDRFFLPTIVLLFLKIKDKGRCASYMCMVSGHVYTNQLELGQTRAVYVKDTLVSKSMNQVVLRSCVHVRVESRNSNREDKPIRFWIGVCTWILNMTKVRPLSSSTLSLRGSYNSPLLIVFTWNCTCILRHYFEQSDIVSQNAVQ